MEFKDYYATLGLTRDASAEDIKRAYRKLARKHHPDLNKAADAEAQFKALGEAYEVLKDPEKRAAYDAVGQQWQAGGSSQPPPGWDAGFEFSGAPDGGGDFADHSDFFEALFGQVHAQQRGQRAGGGGQRRGSDHHARIEIALEEAYRGGTRSISLRAPVANPAGGVQLAERTLDVTIPKGVREGQHLRLAGQGGPGSGGAPAGDLYLVVSFAPHRHFRVDDRDVYVELPVAPWEAALGAEVRVPTPDGTLQIAVPAGSAAGRRMRLKGRGIPGQPPGDLYAVLQIALPPAGDESARQAYRDLAQSLPFNPRAHLGV